MKTILLVSHVSETPGGPLEKFYAYLKNKNTIYKITHPILLTTKQKSSIDLETKNFTFKIPPFLQYTLEGVYTLVIWYKHFKTAPKIDLAICFDSLAYFHTYLFKKLLRIDTIVYYNVDYSKKRFSNLFMNTIYHAITKFSYNTCDYFFSFSNKFIEENDPARKYASKHFFLKPTVDLASIDKTVKKIPKSLVYAGALDYGTTDFIPMLEALKRLKEEGIVFRLDVYSKINPENPIPGIVKKFNLEKNVFFQGIVNNSILMQKILPKYLIGVAPYATASNAKSPDHAFMNKDLTGRLVEYIGAGLPVVSTRITKEFRMIDDNKIGFSVITTQEWYHAIKTLLIDQDIYNTYSHNAFIFAKNYDTDTLLTPVFRKILNSN